MQTQSEGLIDPKILDVTEEPDNNKKKYKEIDLSDDLFSIKQRIRPDGTIEYYIDRD